MKSVVNEQREIPQGRTGQPAMVERDDKGMPGPYFSGGDSQNNPPSTNNLAEVQHAFLSARYRETKRTGQ